MEAFDMDQHQHQHDQLTPLSPNDIQQESFSHYGVLHSHSPKVIIAFITCWTIEIIATLFVLSTQSRAQCDVPLWNWLLIFTARIPIVAPLRMKAYREGINMSRQVMQLDSLLELLVLVWFIFGQFWMYTSETCVDTAPRLYHYAMALFVMMYIYVSLPLIFVVLVCICLPCVALALRAVGVKAATGGSDRQIQRLQTHTYQRVRNGDEEDIRSEGSSQEEPLCAVCYQDFQVGEQIMVLPCGHDFHRNCVAEWLRRRMECPLCRAAV